MKNKLKQVISLFFFVFISLAVGYLSSQFTGVQMASSYAQLNKPFFAPPASVFGPVWTILYILMGLAAYLVWKSRKSKNVKPALALFFFQLILNFFWTIIFFGMKAYTASLVEILVLLITIVVMTISFEKISKKAAYLLLPYLFWVGFASVLTFAVSKIN